MEAYKRDTDFYYHLIPVIIKFQTIEKWGGLQFEIKCNKTLLCLFVKEKLQEIFNTVCVCTQTKPIQIVNCSK